MNPIPIAWIEIRNRKYILEQISYDFHQAAALNGKLSSGLFGGNIYFVTESTGDDHFLASLLSAESNPIEGSVKITDSATGNVIRTIQIHEAYVGYYSDEMYSDKAYGMKASVSLLVTRMDINSVEMDRRKYFYHGWVQCPPEPPKPIGNENPYTPPQPLVTSVKGETTALPYQKVTYTVTGYNIGNVADNDRKRIKWKIAVDDNEQNLKETGEKIEIEMKPEWTGKDVTVMPYLRKPNDEVSVKTTVERFPKSILFARSMKRPGKTLTGETAEDMLCADKTPEEVRRMHRLFGLQLKASDKELFADMHMLAGMGSLSGGGELLTALIGHFKDSTGTPFSNAYMDQKLKEHPSFHTFVYQEKGVFFNLNDQLKDASGNINKIQMPLIGKISSDRTKFNTLKDKLNGMTLAVDDTSAYEVYVDDYKLTAPNTFSCNLRIIVYDNYGLDAADIVKYGTIAGFRAWYVLQHVRGYKPFLTKMTCIIPIRNKTF